MRAPDSIWPVVLLLGIVGVVIYLLTRNSAANSNPFSLNPFANQFPPNPGYGPNSGGVSVFNPGYSLGDLFGPGPNLSSGAVGNGGAVDPSINTGADFNGSESDPAGETSF